MNRFQQKGHKVCRGPPPRRIVPTDHCDSDYIKEADKLLESSSDDDTILVQSAGMPVVYSPTPGNQPEPITAQQSTSSTSHSKSPADNLYLFDDSSDKDPIYPPLDPYDSSVQKEDLSSIAMTKACLCDCRMRLTKTEICSNNPREEPFDAVIDFNPPL